MRVAIDSGPLTGGHSVRGVGVSVKGLIGALQKYNRDKDIKISPLDFTTADLSGFDILHHTSFNPYFLNYPRLSSVKAKTIITIHDLIPVIYKSHYPPGIKGNLRWYMNKFLVNRADKIITVSETSKKDIVRLLGVDSEKINVIYWGIDACYSTVANDEDGVDVRRLYRLPKKFILYVGDVNYNKNLATLIEACSIINTPLVIVGKQAGNLDELVESWKNMKGPKDLVRSLLGKSHPELAHFEKLKSSILKNNVITTGYVPTTDLVKIFRLATVYCQPSLYEGFGIPVLEAFASEVPVVLSKTQALTEIAGGAAITAHPYNPKDFADKISSLMGDSSMRLHYIRAGATRVKEFSWQKTVVKTVEVYRRVYGI